ncbi:triosephosphate isomerase [Bifidobacterium sp. B4081]|nr:MULTISPECIES: triose-phosphate isomerase family protein [unclassified Bifidobacterium]MCX8644595.1 triosephosphate isomerase [Bifidobacterium sp. B4077]MCX8646291.1 triosephosphate isomerase [Bifidobacterium sp. B4081]MCX8658967.1 triosephosphate isomerase [Bifidobacterium sp. B4114]MCX8667898.1 triosephosphate isomerase [Bifidobacterium sp. B3998]
MAIVALSTKMYFPRKRTLDYCQRLVQLLKPIHNADSVVMAVLPDFLTIAPVKSLLKPAGVLIGAQDVCPNDRGAYTGEVSGSDLAALGASIVEIGHIERRRYYHEDDALISGKVAAARRNGLTPLLCVGEPERMDAGKASQVCIREINNAVDGHKPGPLWVAYEPIWAIGAQHPASTEHVREVCTAISNHCRQYADKISLIYGGSAGPGLLTELWPAVDGLFLGRFAHEPEAFISVVQEACILEAS